MEHKFLHLGFVESGYPHPHGGGGAGTYVQLIGRKLVRRGHKVSIIAGFCSACPTENDDQGVKVYRPKFNANRHYYLGKVPLIKGLSLGVRNLERGFYQYRFIERLHRVIPIDIVEFTEGGDFWHAWRAPFPYVVHLHGSRFTFLSQSGRTITWRDWFDRKLELAFIRRARFIFSPSQAILDIVKREAGDLPLPAYVIPYPFDPKLIQPPSPTTYNNSKKVLFAARNDPVKGAEVLLQAVPLVRQHMPNVEFHFFGFKEKNNQVIPEEIEVHPFIQKDELLKYYPVMDVCVVPSFWDNSPNTVYEAMAAGKAVVASNAGGIPELVIDGETGILVPPGDSIHLAKAIIDLLCNDEKRKRMGKMGKERIREIADLEKNVDLRLSLYVEIIRNHHG